MTTEKRYHTLVLTSEQLNAIHDGMEMLRKQYEWARFLVPESARKQIDKERDNAFNAMWAAKEHLSTQGSIPAACERAGCGWLPSLAVSDKSADDTQLSPEELLIKRVADLLEELDAVESSSTLMTQWLAEDPSRLYDCVPGKDGWAEGAKVHLREPGMGPMSRPTPIRVLNWMKFHALRSQASGVRSALRSLRRSRQPVASQS